MATTINRYHNRPLRPTRQLLSGVLLHSIILNSHHYHRRRGVTLLLSSIAEDLLSRYYAAKDKETMIAKAYRSTELGPCHAVDSRREARPTPMTTDLKTGSKTDANFVSKDDPETVPKNDSNDCPKEGTDEEDGDSGVPSHWDDWDDDDDNNEDVIAGDSGRSGNNGLIVDGIATREEPFFVAALRGVALVVSDAEKMESTFSAPRKTNKCGGMGDECSSRQEHSERDRNVEAS